MSATTPSTDVSATHATLLAGFLAYLRTFRAPPGVFAPDVECTYHVPGGHYVQRTPQGLEAELAPYGDGSEVAVKASAITPEGFVVEFTQRSRSGDLYEELVWAEARDGRIRTLRCYCTGVVRDG